MAETRGRIRRGARSWRCCLAEGAAAQSHEAIETTAWDPDAGYYYLLYRRPEKRWQHSILRINEESRELDIRLLCRAAQRQPVACSEGGRLRPNCTAGPQHLSHAVALPGLLLDQSELRQRL